jgi:transcriptional/translational regulatory protein YebC/TACO1
MYVNENFIIYPLSHYLLIPILGKKNSDRKTLKCFFKHFSKCLFLLRKNINRAIKKASESNVGDFSEYTFEAYGFGGASFVITVLTDNTNRATSDVKSCVNKRQGKIAEQGSVLFLYDRKGKVEVPAVLEEEALLEAAIEAGCEDMELVQVCIHLAI